MKNKVLLISLAVVLALSFSIVGCGGEEEEETWDLVFSDHNPPQNPTAQALQLYGAYLEDHSDGRITCEVHIDGELYADTELFEAVQTGGCDAGSYVPEIGDGIYLYNVMNMPFMGWPLAERDVIDIALTLMSEFPEIQEEFTDQGVIYPVTRAMPPVQLHLHSNATAVSVPGDLAGLKIITLENLNVLTLETLGATGIKLGFLDLFTALRPPYLADGFINHYALLVDLDWLVELQSHTHFGAGGMYRQPLGILWNKAKYDAIVAAGFGDVLDDAYDVWLDKVITGTQPELDAAAAYIVSHNHTVVDLTPAEVAAFATAAEPVYDAWITLSGQPAVAEAVFNRTIELIAAS